MAALHTLLLLTAGLSLALADADLQAIWQFRNMMICTMPESWPVLDYADYGCYCGIGGSGTPVDMLDRCCQVHDMCYEAARVHDACWPLINNPYTQIYHYVCNNKTVTCTGRNNECEKFICECDRMAAMCFAEAEYIPGHEHLPSDRCE
ncbi:hypothetical protein SKAU_G00002220 [Synaphobranchus kaupii]|uniref:Phospholipase A2 n=1 Tax=Synaphobranchus kaupii TaxID=118154 RepID=A0A9Q1G8F6_SYNKA|nr:hypothetical protein SKAU_G00002220 [Synaphobranchus kaupii]